MTDSRNTFTAAQLMSYGLKACSDPRLNTSHPRLSDLSAQWDPGVECKVICTLLEYLNLMQLLLHYFLLRVKHVSPDVLILDVCDKLKAQVFLYVLRKVSPTLS